MIDELWVVYKKQEEGNSQLTKVQSKKIRSGQTRHAGPRQRKRNGSSRRREEELAEVDDSDCRTPAAG